MINTRDQGFISELMAAEVVFLDRFGWSPVAVACNGGTVVQFKNPKTGALLARSAALAKLKADLKFPV